jgi:hypothetical protein
MSASSSYTEMDDFGQKVPSGPSEDDLTASKYVAHLVKVCNIITPALAVSDPGVSARQRTGNSSTGFSLILAICQMVQLN